MDLCLNGYIAKSGLINTRELELYIDKVSKGLTSFQWSLDHLLCYEIFVRFWEDLI